MATEDIKEEAYTAIDRLLLGLQDGAINCFGGITHQIFLKPWYGYFREIIDKYGFIVYHHWDHSSMSGIVSLKGEGMKAIEIGGIREYMIAYDRTFKNSTGYPKLCIGSVGGKAKTKRFVYNEAAEAITRQFFSGPMDTLVIFDPPDQESQKPPVIQSVPVKRGPASEGPWTKTGVIIAIIVCIITALGVYYAWLGLHPGK